MSTLHGSATLTLSSRGQALFNQRSTPVSDTLSFISNSDNGDQSAGTFARFLSYKPARSITFLSPAAAQSSDPRSFLTYFYLPYLVGYMISSTMKYITLLLAAASSAGLTTAQLQYNQTTNQFTCAKANQAYCVSDSLQSNIIVRCDQDAIGGPGNCDDVRIINSSPHLPFPSCHTITTTPEPSSPYMPRHMCCQQDPKKIKNRNLTDVSCRTHRT